jgi:hypothetical protein
MNAAAESAKGVEPAAVVVSVHSLLRLNDDHEPTKIPRVETVRE